MAATLPPRKKSAVFWSIRQEALWNSDDGEAFVRFDYVLKLTVDVRGHDDEPGLVFSNPSVLGGSDKDWLDTFQVGTFANELSGEAQPLRRERLVEVADSLIDAAKHRLIGDPL